MSEEQELEFDPQTVTGNPARDLMLGKAIAKAGPDLEAIQAALPSNFGTDLEEVNKMLTVMGKDPIGGDTLPTPEMSVQEAQAVLNEWQHRMQLARIALRDRDIEQRTARQKLVESIDFFLTGGAKMTPEQLKREYLASEAAERAKGKRRGQVRSQPGPSVVDIGRAGQSSVNRDYAPKRRPDMMSGQPTYSLAGSTARSGSGIIDKPGVVAVPAVKQE